MSRPNQTGTPVVMLSVDIICSDMPKYQKPSQHAEFDSDWLLRIN